MSDIIESANNKATEASDNGQPIQNLVYSIALPMCVVGICFVFITIGILFFS